MDFIHFCRINGFNETPALSVHTQSTRIGKEFYVPNTGYRRTNYQYDFSILAVIDEVFNQWSLSGSILTCKNFQHLKLNLHENNFISVMVKSEMAIEEGSPLRIECTLDAILTDLKYKRVNDKKLRNIFTKTAKKEKMIYMPTTLVNFVV